MMAVVLVVVAVGVLLIAAFWFIRRETARWVSEAVQQSLTTAQQTLVTLAEQRLAVGHAQQAGDLEARKREVEKTVQGLEAQLAKYEQLSRQVERDRTVRYGALEQQLATVHAETQKLHQTTQQLTSMLGNAKVRGQWGEKTADDILRVCGLREGVHYEKQRNAPLGRPDFTFRLPDQEDHAFYMDVKFPLDNYIKYCNSEREEERRGYQEQFLKDVRTHLRALERRDYAQPASGSPDYVLMFIPNEQVYGAVNEWMPGLIDEALAKRLIVCGPWTLYAHLRLLWQAWQSYYQVQTVGEIVAAIAEFLGMFRLFKERFLKLGEALRSADELYRDIDSKSFKQLDRRIERIQDLRIGQGLDVPGATEQPVIDTATLKELAHD